MNSSTAASYCASASMLTAFFNPDVILSIFMLDANLFASAALEIFFSFSCLNSLSISLIWSLIFSK